MSKPSRHWLQSPVIAVAVTALVLAVYAAGILLLVQHLRGQIRENIVNDDADIIHAVTLMLQWEQPSQRPVSTSDEPAEWMDLVLKASRLKGVVAARLHDPRGNFIAAFPAYVKQGAPPLEVLPEMGRFQNVCRFYENYPLAALLISESGNGSGPAPIVEAFVPLHRPASRSLSGIAQFYLDGRGVAAQVRELETGLWWFGGGVFAIGGIIIAATLLWSFRRLQHAHALLAERTAGLLAANQQLALLTRTSALGALATHLMHEIKSHAFGLINLLSAAPASENDRAAVAAARRVHQLANESLEAIANEQATVAHYEISTTELAETLAGAIRPLARQREVRLVVEQQSQGALSSRVANLVIIVLTHLLQNAVQATRAGGTVTLTIEPGAGTLRFKVRDQGSGFPEALRDRLFRPVPSTKEGGSGVGLALSKQLADHLGAELRLAETGPPGCLFVLSVPN